MDNDLEEKVDGNEEMTAGQKIQSFLLVNKEPLIRAGCIILGIGIGFGVSYWLNSADLSGEETSEEMIDLDIED